MIRSILAPLAAFALSSCFIQPGDFESAMTLNRDGTFDYSYSGEVVAIGAALLEGPGRAQGRGHGRRRLRRGERRVLGGRGATVTSPSRAPATTRCCPMMT